MKLLSILLPALTLFTPSFGARQDKATRFQDFHRLTTHSPTLSLNEATYTTLTAEPRDYSIAILLTALESRFNCQLCREFQPDWEIIGRSWVKGDRTGESRLLFGTLDFVEGKDIFIKVRQFLKHLLVDQRHWY